MPDFEEHTSSTVLLAVAIFPTNQSYENEIDEPLGYLLNLISTYDIEGSKYSILESND